MEARRTRKKLKQQPQRNFGVVLLSTGAAAIGIGAAIGALLFRRQNAPAAGHAAADLTPGATVPPVETQPSNAAPEAPVLAPEARAPEHFRPDPTAVPTAEEREALRPATGSAPGFAADRGSAQADAQDAA